MYCNPALGKTKSNSGIEKEIQMCYSQITKGKPEAAYPKIIVYLPLTRSAVIIAGNGGYFLDIRVARKACRSLSVLIYLMNQTNEGHNEDTELNEIRICNHWHPSFLSSGG